MTKSRKKSDMDTRLSTLIDDYLKAVRTALTLMQQSGITLPLTSANGSKQTYPKSRSC